MEPTQNWRDNNAGSDEASEEEVGDLCGTCNIKVRGGQYGLKCDNCWKLFHTGCVKVSIEEYRMLEQLGDKAIWYCMRCNTKVKDMGKENRKLREENQALKEEMEVLKERFSALEHRVDKIDGNTKESLVKQVTETVLEVVRRKKTEKAGSMTWYCME